MAITWTAARSGVLREWDRRPPPFAFLVFGIVAFSALIAFSGVGRRLARFVPLWALVAVQAFRLPLELAMHAMSDRGIMPGIMSYSGRNFDIVTGASAIVVALLTASGLGGRRLVMIWNIAGLALLTNVVIVAILATPAIRYFGDQQLNVWVTYPPFVWLPAVLVLAALAGHLVIFRALSARAERDRR
jgi:small-conductance mechanosensitive channel